MSKRHTYQFVKKVIEDGGYDLLSTEYKNARENLDMQCLNGHKLKMCYDHFQRGDRCKTCADDKMRLNYDYVKKVIEDEGYYLLSTEYKNAMTKLDIQCPKGHIYQAPYNTFQRGGRCLQCFNEGLKNSYTDVKYYIENMGYKLLSTKYEKSIVKLYIECPSGHHFKMSHAMFLQGNRCPLCARKVSKPEKEVLDYVKTIYDSTIIPNDRRTIFNYWTKKWLELDIWIPEVNKAIEYNNTYWHSMPYIQWKDMMKVRQCKVKGIKLLVIDHNDWIYNKIETMDKIRGFMLI